MDQSTTIQDLTNRLRRIEAEIVAVREALTALPEQQDQLSPVIATVPYAWVNKTAL
jgi:prefoldin subunit 5